jgi:gluconolactonase
VPSMRPAYLTNSRMRTDARHKPRSIGREAAGICPQPRMSEVAAAPTIVGRVPPELDCSSVGSEWAAGVLGTPHVGSFLEGPCVSRDGASVLFSDLAHGRILRLSANGVSNHLVCGGEPNGLAFDGHGGLLIADYRRGLLRVESDGTVSTVLARFRMEPFIGLSDLVVSESGAIFFSDQGQSDLRRPIGRVFRWQHGILDLLAEGIPSPNGLALDPLGEMLYIAVTRANAVWRLPLVGRSTGKLGVYLHLSGGTGGPDGLAADADGGLAVAHYGLGRVWFIDPRGLPDGFVDVPSGLGTTNVAFWGKDLHDVLITEASTGSLWSARAPRRGFPLPT